MNFPTIFCSRLMLCIHSLINYFLGSKIHISKATYFRAICIASVLSSYTLLIYQNYRNSVEAYLSYFVMTLLFFYSLYCENLNEIIFLAAKEKILCLSSTCQRWWHVILNLANKRCFNVMSSVNLGIIWPCLYLNVYHKRLGKFTVSKVGVTRIFTISTSRIEILQIISIWSFFSRLGSLIS